MPAKKSTPAVTVEVAPRETREIVEDTSAKEMPGASPADVYAELEAHKAAGTSVRDALAPVDMMEVEAAKPIGDADIDANGGVVTEEGHLRFGDKVFFADPEKRKTMPRQFNLAAGPRITKLPEPGVFLPATKSFRGVPFRTANGSIRVDW